MIAADLVHAVQLSQCVVRFQKGGLRAGLEFIPDSARALDGQVFSGSHAWMTTLKT